MNTTRAAPAFADPGTRRDRAAWLRLAATPAFGLLAGFSMVAPPGPLTALCGTGTWVDSMGVMYALMALFHLPPWLALTRRH